MTWSQLRTFIAVVDAGSVREAAEQLSVTQSAVSAALGALQRDLGTLLVTKSGRGVRLTPAGEIYARYSRRLLGLLHEAGAAARGYDNPEQGLVRIAAVTTVGEHVLPPLLATFRERWPDVGLLLEVGTRARVWGMAADYECDVALGGRPPEELGWVTQATRANELVLVAAPSLRLLDPERATWLLRERGSGTRDTTLALLESIGADPVQLTLGSNRSVISCAAAGLGVTLVSRDAVARELEAGELELVDLKGTPLSRPWHAVTPPYVAPTTQLLLEHLLSPPDARAFEPA